MFLPLDLTDCVCSTGAAQCHKPSPRRSNSMSCAEPDYRQRRRDCTWMMTRWSANETCRTYDDHTTAVKRITWAVSAQSALPVVSLKDVKKMRRFHHCQGPWGHSGVALAEVRVFHNAWSPVILANICLTLLWSQPATSAVLQQVFSGFTFASHIHICLNIFIMREHMFMHAFRPLLLLYSCLRGNCRRSHVPLSLPVRASVLRHQAGPAAPPDDQGVAAGSAQAAHFSARGSAELWITAQAQAGLWQRAHQSCHDDRGLDLHRRS